jgi:hypothetical protein
MANPGHREGQGVLIAAFGNKIEIVVRVDNIFGPAFSQKIQPVLSNVATSVIRSSIGVSRWYASRIRQGYRPHPRHWKVLAELVGAFGR